MHVSTCRWARSIVAASYGAVGWDMAVLCNLALGCACCLVHGVRRIHTDIAEGELVRWLPVVPQRYQPTEASPADPTTKLATKLDLINRLCPPTATAQDSEFDNDTCVVCLDQMHCGQPQRVLWCYHAFHAKCIEEWFLHQPGELSLSCPLCKRKHPVNLTTARV
mmetsp:Transcript_16420/g.52690  ORF Transcript_16420/g.52690 Transcript_16420/m.52690 type:complete len:165 (-) Transcript_16420:161-655(-)